MNFARLFLLLVFLPVPAAAQESQAAEAEIQAAIAYWYDELAKKDEGRADLAVGRPFFEATRHYYHVDNGSAALGPRVYTSLSATALQFSYDIEFMRIDPNFARVSVWERGYFYAAGPGRTYERAADSDFILERQEKDGRWMIVAYRSGAYGIPPGKETDPMPDLRDLYYETRGEPPPAAGD